MGFIEVRWGKDRQGSAPEEQPVVGQQGAGAMKFLETIQVLKESYAESQVPLLDPVVKRTKEAWVGGAIRSLSILSGKSTEEITGMVTGVRGSTETTTPTSPPESKYAALLTPSVSAIQRPPKHPGAQRPVDPDGPPVEPDVSITSTSLRGKGSD